MVKLGKLFFKIIVVMFIFSFILTIHVNASPWQIKYCARWYKVRVTRSTKADEQTGNTFSYKSHIKLIKRFRLHKGQVVYTSYAAVNGIDWCLSGGKYNPTKNHLYEAHFQKNSFKVIKKVSSNKVKW